MERVVAFYAGPFPEQDRECVECMRLLAEHPAAARTAAGLEAVPFNCFGFGLYPPGRSGDLASPCLTIWFDDPHPLYWVQLRRRVDAEILTCDQCFGPEEAWAAAAEARRQLIEEAERALPEPGGGDVPSEWLSRLSPIANFAPESRTQRHAEPGSPADRTRD